MKNYLSILVIILCSNFAKSQGKFEIRLNTPSNINDSLSVSTREARVGFEEFYRFQLETSKYITDIEKLMGFPFSIYSLRIQKENILYGELDHPVPVAFMKFDLKKDSLPLITDIIFLEKGYYEINLPKLTNKLQIYVDSPANREYRELKKQMAHIYAKSSWYEAIDSLTNFEEKQKILSAYITKNPDSYVALWQIIEDYSGYHEHPDYLANLSLFSEEVKSSKIFKNFKSKLTAEYATYAGRLLPDIEFDHQFSLTKKDFGDYKLTFIDYWTTSCGPCIKSLPEIVSLFGEFKDKGLNVISITDEDTPEKMALAKQILKKNNAEWTNFFDTNDHFKTAVNATGYPLQFLIDNNGKIVTRVMGDFDEIRNTIKKMLR